MASPNALRVAKGVTRFVLNNSKEMGAKLGVVALATFTAGVALRSGLTGADGAEFAKNTMLMGGALTASAVGAVGFRTAFKNPIKALDDWSKNEPLSVLVSAGKSAMKSRDGGERYLKTALDSMSMKHQQQFKDFTRTQQRLSHSDDMRVVEYEKEIAAGLQAYRRVSLGMGPSPEKSRERPRGATYTP